MGETSTEEHDVIKRNIRTLHRVREKTQENRSFELKFADRMGEFIGTMGSIYVHLTFFAVWFAINLGLIPSIRPFDPYPFPMIAVWASIEAIFLTTFVLMNQNRSNMLSEQRTDLDLQINLYTEHELTRLIRITDLIAQKLKIEVIEHAQNLEELKKDVVPEDIIDLIAEYTLKNSK